MIARVRAIADKAGMQRYLIDDEEVTADSEAFEVLVAKAYAAKARPLCLCRRDVKLPLYIARRQDHYVLARWPGTGTRHSPNCDHYETPDFLTGLGQVRRASGHR